MREEILRAPTVSSSDDSPAAVLAGEPNMNVKRPYPASMNIETQRSCRSVLFPVVVACAVDIIKCSFLEGDAGVCTLLFDSLDR